MGDKPRLTINAEEAVNLIRSGTSDTDLMLKYNISARSLERLFSKLVDTGEISRSELDKRMESSQRSHVVDIVSSPVSRSQDRKKKVRISAAEVVGCIRSRMSDIELMDKYNISAKGLDRLFRKLVSRGDVEQSELDERKKAFQWSDLAFVRSNGHSVEAVLDAEDGPEHRMSALPELWEQHRVAIAAALGALGGVIGTLIVMLMLMGVDQALQLIGRAPPAQVSAVTVPDSLDAVTKQMTTVLESIARGEQGTKDPAKETGSQQYEECLKRCDSRFSGGDAADRALWVNCRKNCVLRYSERMKKIRELYYRSGGGG